MRRRLFHVLAAVSLVLCVATGALWVRSLGHFEEAQVRYTRSTSRDEGRSVYLILSWYSDTLRLRVIDSAWVPVHFHDWSNEQLDNFNRQRRAGLAFNFDGDDVTRFMNGYPPGFTARYYPDTNRPPAYGGQFILAVRPWLPTLLFAVIPGIWICKSIKARRALRRGMCPTCGYDLRATPDRCPECGTAVAPTV